MCEGYTDVIGCFQAGAPWAVATCGTALAEEHFTLLRNFAKRIVLAYDADAAGQSATSRVYEWERKHEVDVVVADLPGGSDPGDLARTRPRRAGHGDPRGPALPPVPRRPHARDRQPHDGRGAGPGGRGRAHRGCRAPRRSGARPVRHAAGRSLPGRRGEAARATRVSPRAPSRRERTGTPQAVLARRRTTAVGVPRGRRRQLRPRRLGSGNGPGCSPATWAWARGAQAGGAPARRSSRSSACRALRRCAATPGVCGAAGE